MLLDSLTWPVNDVMKEGFTVEFRGSLFVTDMLGHIW